MTQTVPTELELLRMEVTTLRELLDVHEEQAARQFAIIREQKNELDAAVAELSSNADFLREVYRTLPGALIVANADGVVGSGNEGAMRMLEWRGEDGSGLHLSRILGGGEVELERIVEALRGGRIFNGETSLLTQSGGVVDVILHAALSGEDANDPGKRKLVVVALDIRERKRLEVELRQAQKLESVGRLAAGVAHEINTPVQFVSDSVQFLRDALGELTLTVKRLRAASDTVECDVSNDDDDIEYLLENVPRAFDRTLDGLARIAAIVRSMKDFAHPDAKEMRPADLNRAIESTLTIARNEYKYVADVVTSYGELPLLTCHVGDINQAVLNIVVNAAHAIGDVVEDTQARGRISVSTRHESEHVAIEISDTGGGIPPAIQSRIFDPFFTTKAVGRGTGQGLAIARSVVVDKHGGELSFETHAGVGTTFVIRLPIHGKEHPPGA